MFLSGATVAYASREEAGLASDVLRDFGITSRTEVSSDFTEPDEWWEVTIVELPARWFDSAGMVAGRSSPPTPSVEPDEHDRGASSWWDRD